VLDLSLVGPAQADHSHDQPTFRVDQDVDAIPDQSERNKSFFAMPIGWPFDNRIPLELGGEAEGDASLLFVAVALLLIELDLQVLIVYTLTRPHQRVFPIATKECLCCRDEELLRLSKNGTVAAIRDDH
jgi:hypothetical protein